MQAALTIGRRCCAISVLVLTAAPAWAGPASETLLPNTTKGYVSVAQLKQFDERWDKTQLGQLFNDDIMQPFVEDFRKQLREEIGAVERKLGITWDDLKGVTSGEMSLAIIERKTPDAVLAITIDVTGHEQEADGLLAAIEKRFAARSGQKTTVKVGDTTLLVFDVPTDTPAKQQQTIYFIKDNVLCGVDDRAEAEAMLKRFAGGATDNLESVLAFTETMERCHKEAGNLEPEARWFIEPFGFIFAERTLRQNASPQGSGHGQITLRKWLRRHSRRRRLRQSAR